MGNALLTFPCTEPTNTKKGVMVMRVDGSLLRFKRGIHAKDVVSANPGYRVVRCDSDRTVLWGSAELESNRLYFLLPEDKARSRAAFEKFWRVGESKGLVPPRTKGSFGDGQCRSFGGSAEFRRLAWTPQLRTIPEILSPPVLPPPLAQDRLMMKSSQTQWSLGEELGIASPLPSPIMVM